MTQEDRPRNCRWSGVWTQLLIAVVLIIGGLVCWCLGANAGFGGKTDIGIVDWIVGNGCAFFHASFFIAGAGVVWMLLSLFRWLLKAK